MSILWVDDELHLVVNDGKNLEAKTAQRVLYAADIATALTRIELDAPELVILDIRIPVGTLPKQHANLHQYFESDKENAGFGFLRLFCEASADGESALGNQQADETAL